MQLDFLDLWTFGQKVQNVNQRSSRKLLLIKGVKVYMFISKVETNSVSNSI